ncbi:MAG: lysophospholipid acyltransferase family protein [Vicingaceae bacterium]
MRKYSLLWWLYQPYKWLVFVPLLGISGMVLAIFAIFLAIFVSPSLGNTWGGISWARFSSFFTPMWVNVSGIENIDRNQSYIVVSNHQSHFDIFVIYGWLKMDMKWVMKKELRKIPFIGYACEKVGHIIVDRSDRAAAIQAIEKAKKNIVNGTSVMFFPEGTRSKDGAIGVFKKGAFVLALQLGLPILPITINGTRKILPSGSLDLLPGRAEAIVHPAVDTSVYTEKNMAELISKVRDIIVLSFDAEGAN